MFFFYYFFIDSYLWHVPLAARLGNPTNLFWWSYNVPFISELPPSRLSSSPTPPPLLPPKTRKLQQLGGAAGTNQSGPGNQAASTGVLQSATGIQTPGPAVLQNNNTKSQAVSSTRERSSKVTITGDFGLESESTGPPSLGRSISSVGHNGHVVRKPVRRSKSQLPGSKYVANIQHGGLVTLVSLRNVLFKNFVSI